MDGILKVTPEKLLSTSEVFSTTGKQVRNLTQEMLELVRGLLANWEGEAATAYTGQFNKLEDDMEKMHKMIEEHVKDLVEMAQQYQNAETTNTEAGSSLAGDIIS